MRPTAIGAVLAALALTALPAGAAAKIGVESNPPLETLAAGDPTNIELTVIRVHAAEPGPAAGVVPSITFTEHATGKGFTVRGARTDADGLSTVRVTIPRAGAWEADVHDGLGGSMPMPLTIADAAPPAPTPTAPAAPADPSDGALGGLAWAGIATVALIALAALAMLLVRRTRRSGRLPGPA